MSLDLFHRGALIGSVVRSRAGAVYAYSPDGQAIGQFHDVDAAALALIAHADREPVAA